MDWLTIGIAAGIGALFVAVVAVSIRNKKKGKSSCSCGSSCAGCPMGGACHGDK